MADFLTLGNHAFDADGYEEFLESEKMVARPANFGERLPGQGWGIFEVDGVSVGVTNVLGLVFVDRTPVSPFVAADRAVSELEVLGADLVLVDTHAEATSEKQALGHHLAGRAQAVLGTHTHVPTADATILPGGTAYATDVGMTGCEESIIGFDRGRLHQPVPGRATEDPGGGAGPGELERHARRLRRRGAPVHGDRAGSPDVGTLDGAPRGRARLQ